MFSFSLLAFHNIHYHMFSEKKIIMNLNLFENIVIKIFMNLMKV